MACRFKIGAVVVALALVGCKGSQPASASTRGDSANGSSTAEAGATTVAGADNASGTRLEYITDPTLNNMRVMPIQIPASWKFRGVLVAKTPCTFDLSEVFRATSPDGHSFVEVMPTLGWKWGNVPGFTPTAEAACLPINGPMSAQEFLKYFSTTLQVQYLGDEPMPGQQPGGIQTPMGRVTGAMANVGFRNGPVHMTGLLAVVLTCRQIAPAAGRCNAVVHYSAAPDNQFAQVRQIWSAPGMGKHKELADWVAAWSQRYNNQNQEETRQLINESNGAFAARQQMYKDAAVVQQQAHNQFLQTMRDGTDRSMENAARIANSNHTMASDMVDYSLDRQTVIDLNTGRTGKISNQVTPGGSLQKVHGDGTPF